MRDRALSPVVGTVLLVALAVVSAGVVGALLVDAPPDTGGPTARLTLSADAGLDRISVTHRGGDALRPDRLRVRVRVDGQPLRYQPPIPFFAADGFRSGPTGPFNRATQGDWTAGETGSIRLAGTNAPRIDPGDSVAVDVYANGTAIAHLSTTAG